MSKVLIERRLFDVAQRLKRAREELSVIEEQLAVLSETADVRDSAGSWSGGSAATAGERPVPGGVRTTVRLVSSAGAAATGA